MLSTGRLTAAVLVICTGVGLWLSLWKDTEILLDWLQYWPILLISLGIEYLVGAYLARDGNRKMRLDIGALVLAILVTGSVMIIFFEKSFFDQISISFASSGKPYEKETMYVPLDSNTETLHVKNANGNITLTAGDGDQIVIQSTVVIDEQNKSKIQELVEQSKVVVDQGKEMVITAEGHPYYKFLWESKARMDLVITVPRDLPLDMELTSSTGHIQAQQVLIRNEFRSTTVNGDISVSDLRGEIIVSTTTGDVHVFQSSGNVWMKSVNGSLKLTDHEGNAECKTTNGDVYVNGMTGNFVGETVHGDVEITEIDQNVNLQTSNGDITIASSGVGGDWKIQSTTGDISVSIPPDGDYELIANTVSGRVQLQDMDLQGSNKHTKDQVGAGTYHVQLESIGGSIEIKDESSQGHPLTKVE